MPLDLASLYRLAQAATPGPWRSSREDMDSYTKDEDGEMSAVAYVYRKPEPRIGVFGEKFRDDSRFIAAASPDVVLALLDRLEKAEAMAEALREIADMASKLREHTTGGPLTHAKLVEIEAYAIGSLAEAPPSASPRAGEGDAHGP